MLHANVVTHTCFDVHVAEDNFFSEEYVPRPSGGISQEDIIAFYNNYDLDDDLQYDTDSRGKKQGQTLSDDDDGISYINGEFPYSDD